MSRIEQKQNRINIWWTKKEKLIKSILIIMLILLIFIQYGFLNSGFRSTFSRIEKLEGKSIDDSQTYINRGFIEISLDGAMTSKLPIIYVNGKKTVGFSKNKAVIQVMENDIIEINGVGINGNVKVHVTNASDNIKVPTLGDEITVKNNIVFLARVKFM